MMAQEVFLLFSNMVALFTALLFVRAAMHKLGDRYRLQGILADYAILPERSLATASYALPVLELGAAVLLLLPTTRPLGGVLAGTLLAIYAIAMGASLRRGRYMMDCGCGGAPEPISWLLVARNTVLIALLAPTAAGLVYGGGISLTKDVATLGIAVLLLLLWLAAETLFSNARRMNEGLPSPTTTWSAP